MRVLAVRSPKGSVVSDEAAALMATCDYLGDLRLGAAAKAVAWWVRHDPRRLAATHGA